MARRRRNTWLVGGEPVTHNEKAQYLRREHGLTDEQIGIVLEDCWDEFWGM